MLQLRHTLGPGVDDQFHVAVVRDKLTRNLASLYPDVLDEIAVSFSEYIPATEGESVRIIPVQQSSLMILKIGRRSVCGLSCRRLSPAPATASSSACLAVRIVLSHPSRAPGPHTDASAGRDQAYLDVAVNFTNDVFASCFLINLFPAFLKPCVFPCPSRRLFHTDPDDHAAG